MWSSATKRNGTAEVFSAHQKNHSTSFVIIFFFEHNSWRSSSKTSNRICSVISRELNLGKPRWIQRTSNSPAVFTYLTNQVGCMMSPPLFLYFFLHSSVLSLHLSLSIPSSVPSLHPSVPISINLMNQWTILPSSSTMSVYSDATTGIFCCGTKCLEWTARLDTHRNMFEK